MKEEYERDLHHSWLILELEQIYEEDYQMRMLVDNNISGLLDVRGQGCEDKSRYRYEIGGKISIKDLWEKEKWGFKKLEDFMRQFIQILYELNNYLLDVNNLSLRPEHIYESGGKYHFCFVPGAKGNIWKGFHLLMEEFVRVIDYEDKEGIFLAYELHKASMEETYDIEQVLEQILEKKEVEMERVKPKKRKVVYDVEEEQILDAWAGEKRLQGKVLRDRDTVWGFVSKKIRGRK